MSDPFVDAALDDDPGGDAYVVTIARTNGLISSITWVDGTTGNRFKATVYSRTNGLVTSKQVTVYDTADGTTIRGQKTVSFTRTNGQVTSMASTRNS